jgi:hypothetical protein
MTAFGGLAPGSEWTFETGGKAARVAVTAALSSNQIDALLDACVRGAGLGQFLVIRSRRCSRHER